MQKYDSAFSNYYQASEMFLNLHGKDSKIYAECLLFIAKMAYRMKDLKKSIEYSERAL